MNPYRSRYQRRTSDRFFQGTEVRRLLTLIFMLGAVWMLYERTSNPASWDWMAEHLNLEAERRDATLAQAPADAQAPAAPKRVVMDPEQREALAEQFQALTDRQPLTGIEMPAYWRLMAISNQESFADLEASARRDVVFTDLWDRPDKYRGELVRLRLHVQRVLGDAAPQNSAGVQRVYEAWGWTDESKTYPYVVVFSELPAGMPEGPDIREEATFVGYFLKIMSYKDGLEVQRAAPLLVGRLSWRADPHRAALRQKDTSFWPAFFVASGVVLVIVLATWLRIGRRTPRPEVERLASKAANVDGWLQEVQQAEDDESSSRRLADNTAKKPAEKPTGRFDWPDDLRI